MFRTVATAAALAILAHGANAQIVRIGTSSEPAFSTSASIGLLQAQDVTDGSTSSVWEFGSALQYRITLEKTIGRGAGLGIVVGYANMPMVFDRTGPLPAPTEPCPTACDASGDLWTVAASFHAGGGGVGFNQIIEIGLGVSIFGNFREDDSGAKLGPENGDKDFTLSLGYGFGWGVNERLNIGIVQDAGFTVHQRSGLAGNSSSVNRLLVTRLVVRVGLGG